MLLFLSYIDAIAQALPADEMARMQPYEFSKVTSVLLEKAKSEKLILGNMDLATQPGELTVGDALTFHAVLSVDNHSKEWLIGIVWQGKTSSDKHDTVKRFASTGDVFKFVSGKGQIRVTTLGPVNPGETGVKRVSKKVWVKTEFLRLGFYEAADLRFTLNLNREAKPDLPRFWFFTNRSKPVDQHTVAKQQDLMRELAIDRKQLRAVSGQGVALDSFVNLMADTPGIKEILWSIAKKPSWFSMLTQGIRTSDRIAGNITTVNPKNWGLSENASCYLYPLVFSTNGKESLNVVLFITRPEGPIQQSAGTFGLVAYPTANAEKRKLTIKLVGVKSNQE